ncbi:MULTISPECIES: hypothetical protein [Pantoea]|uniref:hypothetical protein n=1 Tax=Pantoea TaxID=53335 RepID=UPI00257B9ECE|nr:MULTISPECIES: hypothetical protein [Pantoea]
MNEFLIIVAAIGIYVYSAVCKRASLKQKEKVFLMAEEILKDKRFNGNQKTQAVAYYDIVDRWWFCALILIVSPFVLFFPFSIPAPTQDKEVKRHKALLREAMKLSFIANPLTFVLSALSFTFIITVKLLFVNTYKKITHRDSGVSQLPLLVYLRDNILKTFYHAH